MGPWPTRDKLLLKSLSLLIKENALLRLQAMVLTDPNNFQWAFIKVNDMVNRLTNGPTLPD